MRRAVGNHLWQSTLFAAAAGLLTLALRKNHARARYWLWLAASLKFLVPFSLADCARQPHGLVTRRLPRAQRGALFCDRTGKPALSRSKRASQTASSDVLRESSGDSCRGMGLRIRRGVDGMVRALAAGFRGHAERRAIRKKAAKWKRCAGWSKQEESEGRLKFFLSRASLEPGILGIVKPVLVWPQGISDRLEDAHLEAILAHEVWHVRRNDNLAAAVHMVVEAIFWFHPLVWWLGARMVEERERACDEEVLQLGSQPQVYAESILKICEFCVGSPLACVAGVTGSDLKKRIANIMNKNIVQQTELWKETVAQHGWEWRPSLCRSCLDWQSRRTARRSRPDRIRARRRLPLLVDISRYQSRPAKLGTELSKQNHIHA